MLQITGHFSPRLQFEMADRQKCQFSATRPKFLRKSAPPHLSPKWPKLESNRGSPFPHFATFSIFSNSSILSIFSSSHPLSISPFPISLFPLFPHFSNFLMSHFLYFPASPFPSYVPHFIHVSNFPLCSPFPHVCIFAISPPL